MPRYLCLSRGPPVCLGAAPATHISSPRSRGRGESIIIINDLIYCVQVARERPDSQPRLFSVVAQRKKIRDFFFDVNCDKVP